MLDRHRVFVRRCVGAGLLTLALLVSLGTRGSAAAGENGPRQPEYLIKAAYLYNFALFVEWPDDAFADPDAPFVVGILEPDPFGWAIDKTVEGKRINRRRIVVERLQSTQDLRYCHILFVGSADGAATADLTKRLGSLPILIVGDAPKGAAPSGTVSFTVQDDKVGFEIDLQAARRTRLKIGSRILSLARTVRGS
jgi:hypothetical protein